MTAATPPHRTSVLIVEDDDAVADLHARYLADLPEFDVMGRVASVREALAVLETQRPDLLLLDMYLADGTGLNLLRRIRVGAREVFDVIMITSASERPLVEHALGLGVTDYLLKPFTRQEFAKRLGAYARGRAARLRAPSSRPLTQSDIDVLRDPDGVQAILPKGLSAATNELVSAALRDARRPMTATDIAERVGVSRVSARRYLEQLTVTGRASSRPRYGEPGRPTTEYVWVD